LQLVEEIIDNLLKNTQGFTLIELVVILIIIGILVSLGMPQYIITVERARATEGIYVLGVVRHTQLRYFQAVNRFIDNCVIDETLSDPDCAGLDITAPTPRFFSNPAAQLFAGFSIVGTVTRNNNSRSGFFGPYVLYIAGNGNVCCDDAGVAGTCNRLNLHYTNDANGCL